ncbi:hypothetical protein [Pseudaestuariivita sp.]|uniref:hypothetical protein n=1 Tax=Pseudaestuariivita sp. TaxID=2211669 RepID=UPI00405A07CC
MLTLATLIVLFAAATCAVTGPRDKIGKFRLITVALLTAAVILASLAALLPGVWGEVPRALAVLAMITVFVLSCEQAHAAYPELRAKALRLKEALAPR